MTRVRTGIPGLDEMLGGGFMQGDTVMVAGGAGTGKTTLALQYVVNGITRFGENGIYVTFEQMPDQIHRDCKSFGWDLRRMEEENKLRLVCTSPNLFLESGGVEGMLGDCIKEILPRRIVVDSLTHLEMFSSEKDFRKEIYRLLMYFKTKGLSSLSTWETAQEDGLSFAATRSGMSFLVDCVLLIRYMEIESAIRKGLVIMKMRGSDHDKHLREFEITSQGVRVTVPFVEYEGLMTGTPRRTMTETFTEAFKKRRRS